MKLIEKQLTISCAELSLALNDNRIATTHYYYRPTFITEEVIQYKDQALRNTINNTSTLIMSINRELLRYTRDSEQML